MRILGGLAAVALLSACSTVVPRGDGPPTVSNRPAPSRPVASRPQPSRPAVNPTNPPARMPTASTPMAAVPVAAVPTGVATAVEAGVVAGPTFSALSISRDNATAALAAFRTSCSGLMRRTDSSGLTRGADWKPACDAAGGASDSEAATFFARWFEVVQVGDGRAQATGYYEPEIAGSRTRRSGYEVPVYRRPSDLIEVDLGLFSSDLKGKRIRGRVDGTGFVPYHDRTRIEEGALAGKGLEIAYAADPVELFFLQIQGSGRLRLPDGSVMRIGYDNQNGREYVGIGSLVRSRNLLQPGQTSMQGIMNWLRTNPVEGRAIMRENKSYVFFRELTGPGPLGAMGYPVVGQASVAADPKFIPLGAPVVLSMDRADANGLWIAQDTGGAIKGANRVDTFWGAGDEARAIAGGMNARGTAFLLVPTGTLARLQASRGGTTP